MSESTSAAGRGRGGARGVGGVVLLTALATLATFFTLTGWSDMVAEPNGFLDPIGRIAFLYAVASVVLRVLPVPRWAVVVAQVYLLWVLLTTSSLGVGLSEALLPTPSLVAAHVDALQAGSAAAQRYPSPVPASVQAIHPLLVAGGVGILALVDLLAVTLRRVPLAGLPLLAAFTVPVAILDGFPWLTFAVAGAFFVLLLAADHLSRLSQWGRTFVSRGADEEGSGLGAVEALQRNGALTVQIGAVALAAAVVAPLVVPSYDGLLAPGGPGSGGKGRTVSLDNPITDMQRDLDQGLDVDLLVVDSNDPDISYVRTTALDDFDGDQWRPGKRRLPASQEVDGALPPPVGRGSAYRAQTYSYDMRATENLESTWLPLPFPATSVDVPGDWRYDLDTRDIRSGTNDVDTAQLSWSVTADKVDPRAQDLVESRSAPAAIARRNTELPWDTTPAWLEDVVDSVTRGTDSDFAAAVAMQRWFRGDDRFRYSTDNADGSGIEALKNFLTVERVGYCEQFATAMALMARVHGIPARVAVGFLRGQPTGPGQVVFSTHDLHAWPELFFEGAGWIRFEPTPGGRAQTIPAYTRGRVPQVQTPDPTVAPSQAPSPTPTRQPRRDTTAPTDTTDQGGGPSPWWPVGLVAVVALLLAPRGLRETARRRRTTGEDGSALVEGAWAEVRATAVDLGLGWEDRVTVRVRSRSLEQVLRRPAVGGRRTSADDAVGEPVALHALDTLVTAVERSRFAAHAPTTEQGQQAQSAARTVCLALRQRVDERTRLRANWLPASVLSPARPASAPAPAAAAGERATGAQDGRERVGL